MKNLRSGATITSVVVSLIRRHFVTLLLLFDLGTFLTHAHNNHLSNDMVSQLHHRLRQCAVLILSSELNKFNLVIPRSYLLTLTA